MWPLFLSAASTNRSSQLLLNFFQQLLASSSFHVLLIFYENRTVDTLDILVNALQVHPIRHDLVVFNVDRNLGALALLQPCLKHSIFVELYDDQEAHKLRWPRQAIRQLDVHAKVIRVYANALKMAPFFNQERHTVVVRMYGTSLVVEAFNFNASKLIAIDAAPQNGSDGLYEEMFFDRSIDFEGARLYMWGGMGLPNQFNARAFVRGAEVRGLGGIYAYLSLVIGDYFNASVVFGLPMQESWMDGVDNPYVFYRHLKQRVYQTGFVIPQVQRMSVHFDFFDEFTPQGTRLYPHKQENFVLIVPNYQREQSALWHTFATSPLFSIWCSTITMFTVVRYLLQKIHGRHRVPFDRIAYETCGLSFGWVIVASASSRAERLLNIFISMFAILSGIFFSGLLLQQFAFTQQVPLINTFEDLKAMQRMTIMIPMGLEVNQDMWNPNHTCVYTPLEIIFGEVLNRNTRSSYVLPESVADVLLAEDHMTNEFTETPYFHKISERIYSKHMSLRTTRTRIQQNLNQLMQRLVMHGLIQHFEVQSKLALRVRKRHQPTQHLSESSVSVDQLFFMLIVYWFGQLLGVLVLIVELVYWNRGNLARLVRRRR